MDTTWTGQVRTVQQAEHSDMWDCVEEKKEKTSEPKKSEPEKPKQSEKTPGK